MLNSQHPYHLTDSTPFQPQLLDGPLLALVHASSISLLRNCPYPQSQCYYSIQQSKLVISGCMVTQVTQTLVHISTLLLTCDQYSTNHVSLLDPASLICALETITLALEHSHHHTMRPAASPARCSSVVASERHIWCPRASQVVSFHTTPICWSSPS